MVKIKANGNEIALLTSDTDYISLTDIAKYKSSENPADIIKNWLRNRNTLEFLGAWEKINNLNFKLVEFDQFKSEAGLNSFLMSPQKWIETTNAVGIKSTAGRYGGTYAHSDIAFEFASWISPEFKLYIIQDYQRLKQEESYKNKLEWQTNRYILKLNYTIHTDAIKNNLITPTLTTTQIRHKYTSEADILNMTLYGMTAKEFKNKYPEKEGNLRDNSTIEQLMIMNNL
jgi:ORF014